MPRVVLLLSVVFLYFYNLGLNQVWQPNEAFYADASRNMLKTGDFLTPVFNGELRLNKPPMTYWLTTLSFFLFGVNEFALRFFQVLAGLGTGLLTYMFAKRFSGERAALYSFLALTLSFQFIANARYTSPEALFTFFITLTLYLWHVSYERGSGVLFLLALLSSATAVLTKGPAGFVLPAGVIFFYLLLTDRREVLRLRYYLGTLFVALVSGWWFLYQYMVNREAFLHVFVKENIKRVYALQEDPVYFYLLDINVSFLPYSFVFYIALLWALKERRRELTFPLLWFATIFLVFSLVKMKIPVYVMPAFPAMAVLVGSFLAEGALRRLFVPASLFLSLLMLVAVWVGAFMFKLNLILLALATLTTGVFLAKRWFSLAPAVAGFFLLLYLSGVLLPEVERHRPYRDIGAKIREIDPSGEMRTYEVGAFHYNLPFYADRVVVRNAKPGDIKAPAIALVRENLIDCEALGVWKLYRGSESRFFKFLTDIKRGRRFHDFKLCIFP
ncbi:ArnT family glycosyltransferase [Hydrogenivirga sp.]